MENLFKKSKQLADSRYLEPCKGCVNLTIMTDKECREKCSSHPTNLPEEQKEDGEHG